jgi:hypothetical protein
MSEEWDGGGEDMDLKGEASGGDRGGTRGTPCRQLCFLGLSRKKTEA